MRPRSRPGRIEGVNAESRQPGRAVKRGNFQKQLLCLRPDKWRNRVCSVRAVGYPAQKGRDLEGSDAHLGDPPRQERVF